MVKKKVSYGHEREVAYAIRGDLCVYTSLQQSGSSIQYAEEIIRAICRVEFMGVDDLWFFDLQTSRGYATTKPGAFELECVVLTFFGDAFLATDWCPVRIEEWGWVQEVFADEIRGVP